MKRSIARLLLTLAVAALLAACGVTEATPHPSVGVGNTAADAEHTRPQPIRPTPPLAEPLPTPAIPE